MSSRVFAATAATEQVKLSVTIEERSKSVACSLRRAGIAAREHAGAPVGMQQMGVRRWRTVSTWVKTCTVA